MAQTKLRLLGTFDLEQNGGSVSIRTAKTQALLAYLVLRSTAQLREQIVALLWPDSEPQAGRKNLTNLLWSARKLLGNDLIISEGEWLLLSNSVWVDVQVLEMAVTNSQPTIDQLETAVSHYRGHLLQDLTVADGPEFELWLITERERWRQIYLQLLYQLITRYQQQQAWPKIIDTANSALIADPLQEKMHRALMEAFAQSGDRSRALQQYDLLQTRLRQELDVEPLPATSALRDAILKGNHQQDSQPADQKKRPISPFIGRSAELAHLHRALGQTRRGSIHAVMLTGELGIGKTRLWQEWRSRLTLNQHVWETRCLATSQPIPYAPLTRIISQSPVLDQLTILSPVWLAELALLLPEIRERWPHVPLPITNPPEEARLRLFAAVSQLFQTIQPQVLFIDDLHWVDRATVDCLLYLFDRLKHSLLLVGTYRPEEANTHLQQAVVQWEREGILDRLPIPHLTRAEVTELLSALDDSVRHPEQIYHRTSGNPYFITQLNLVPPDTLPLELTALVETRLSALSPLEQQMLQIVAILEPDATLAALYKILQQTEDDIILTLENLVQLNWLAEQQNRYEFVHPLLAEVICKIVSQSRWGIWHRKAAQALEALYATRLPEIAGQLAHHYREGQSLGLAAHYTEMAAERAKVLHAPVEAIEFYRQAQALDPSPSRQLRLGQTLAMLPDYQLEAREHLQNALLAFEAQGDYGLMLESCTSLIETYIPSEVGETVMEWIAHATTHRALVNEPAIEARLFQLLGLGALWGQHQLAEAEIQLTQSIEIAMTHHLDEIAEKSWFDLGILFLQKNDLSAADNAFREALKLSAKSKNVVLEAVCCNNLAHAALLRGHLSDAHFWVEKGFVTMERYDLMLPRQYLYSSRAEIALANRDLDRAREWFQRSIDEAQRFNNWSHVANVKANLGLVAKADGQLDEALRLLFEAQTMAKDIPHLRSRIELWLSEVSQSLT